MKGLALLFTLLLLPVNLLAASPDAEARHLKALHGNFAEVTAIPRCSGQADTMRAHIQRQAESLGLVWKTDAVGNMLVVKPASRGFENRPAVALQAHMDRVCVAARTDFDFNTMPTKAVVEDGWMRADGTNLGADDATGLAYLLTLMQFDDLAHGKLELLFTVDEETTMAGAIGLSGDVLGARTLINLDSENFSEVTIGSAGGVDNEGVFAFVTQPAPEGYTFYQVKLAGGLGGHSGSDINKGRANMIKQLAAFLNKTLQQQRMVLASMQGGQVSNSIPSSSEALVGVPSAQGTAFADAFSSYADEMKQHLATNDPQVMIALTPVPAPAHVADPETVKSLLAFLDAVPNGVITMSEKIPGLVQTSSNTGVLETTDKAFIVQTFMRSSVDADINVMRAALDKLYATHASRATSTYGEAFPGWDAQPTSPLLERVSAAFQEVCGVKMGAVAIHAGLECGFFAKAFPGMDMVSMGPLVLDGHSLTERLNLATFDDTWRVVLKILENLGSQGQQG